MSVEQYKNKDGYECPFCKKCYSKAGIGIHIWRKHTDAGNNFDPNLGYKDGSRKGWNRGLTSETDVRVKKNTESLIKTLNDRGGSFNGKFHTVESKEKISNVMKQRHKEGKAWNIGQSRWNNKPSYPESFFIKVIENEFEDKDYIREFSVGKYSLDFAWIHKNKVIEIDGEQHERFEEYKLRDAEKDRLLTKLGWEILRIKWIDMFNDTKKYIKIAKDFIDS